MNLYFFLINYIYNWKGHWVIIIKIAIKFLNKKSIIKRIKSHNKFLDRCAVIDIHKKIFFINN